MIDKKGGRRDGEMVAKREHGGEEQGERAEEKGTRKERKIVPQAFLPDSARAQIAFCIPSLARTPSQLVSGGRLLDDGRLEELRIKWDLIILN